MKNRIKQLIEHENVSSAQFAIEIGIGASSLHHIVSGRNNPSLDVIQKILARFPEINAEWLINGNGNMHRDVIQGELFDSPQKKSVLSASSPDLDDNALSSIRSANKPIERILILYKDQSFDIYYP